MAPGMNRSVDLVIVGGGMVGLTLACALKETGLKIAIIEREEAQPRLSLDRDCRVSAIVAGTIRVLEGIGVWERVRMHAEPILTMRVWDDQGTGGIRFEAAEAGLEALGAVVENSLLHSSLLDAACESECIEWHCPDAVASVRWRRGCVEVTLGDGRVYSASLVVGADGGRSWLRGAAGIGVWRHEFHQKGIVATVKTQFPHRQTAYQRFLPTGPLAVLPLTQGVCSIVWSAEEAEADHLLDLDDKAFRVQLFDAFGPLLGEIEAVGERAAFPLRTQMARHLVRPRTALIGDAAHQIHPLAGLGVNLGMRDAMVLAQEIADARHYEEDIGGAKVLERYARARLPDILSVAAAMEGFHHLFTHSWPWLALLRDAGMIAVGNAGPAKRLLMLRAMGLALPVPKQIVV